MSSFDAGVYDFYDDPTGNILREYAPDMDDVPAFVKTAQAMSQRDPGNLFALVMLDEGKVIKKFATADPGNTWLSTLYLHAVKDKLPDEAVKVAAANLIEACEYFEITAPEFLWDLADGPVDTNLVDVSGLGPKVKVASGLEDGAYAIERADGSKYYPLDDLGGVKAANDYFGRNLKQFQPRERREFAVKTAAASARYGMRVADEVADYSGKDYSPELQAYLDVRYLHLMDREAPIETKRELAKLAAERAILSPEDFAEKLWGFDKKAGLDALWDRHVPDPWYSTFSLPAHEKVAKGAVKAPKSWTVGEQRVTLEELCWLAERGYGTISAHFGDAFAKAFLNDPATQFDALPMPNKKFMARLAATHHENGLS